MSQSEVPKSSWFPGPRIRISSAPETVQRANNFHNNNNSSINSNQNWNNRHNNTRNNNPSAHQFLSSNVTRTDPQSQPQSHSHSQPHQRQRDGIRQLLSEREYSIGDVEISGFSTAGKFTSLLVRHVSNRHVRVLFDLGKIVNDSWISTDLVLISHGHLDHCGAVLSHCHLRHLFGHGGAKYLIPEPAAKLLENLIRAAEQLQQGALAAAVIPVPIIPQINDISAPITFRHTINRHFYIEPFRTVHRVPSTGYAIYEKRTRLLPEFVDRPSEEIIAAKRAGRIVTETKDERIFAAFTGDTTIEFLNGPLFIQPPIQKKRKNSSIAADSINSFESESNSLNNDNSNSTESNDSNAPAPLLPIHLLIMEMTFLDESISDQADDCKCAAADENNEQQHNLNEKLDDDNTNENPDEILNNSNSSQAPRSKSNLPAATQPKRKKISHLTDSGHVILGEFLNWIKIHPNGLNHVENILFIHVSQRYSPHFIIETFNTKLPMEILKKSSVMIEKKPKY